MFKVKFPFSAAGLTKQQAAAHLLNRFSFGATPNQISEVAEIGLEKWFDHQLAASINENELNEQLKDYDALHLNNEQILNKFVRADQLLKLAVEKGLVANKDSIKVNGDQKAYKNQLKELYEELNLQPMAELHRQLINQKIIRAIYSKNQLQEVLTSFWFNHFNVSLTKNQSQAFVLNYEQEAIRANCLGSFDALLIATAKHPAMLTYLDNAQSVSNNNEVFNPMVTAKINKRIQRRMDLLEQDSSNNNRAKKIKQLAKAKQQEGLNENFAREVMELHTLGVDGGYTQQDVTELARALTGWTLSPALAANKGIAQQKMIEKFGKETLLNKGFVFENDFMFRADKHDSKEKIILGTKLKEGGGFEEGINILQMLGKHPSTAHFICKKLAIHFVADTPSIQLVQQMANTFIATDGNIKSVLLTMVQQVEFWKAAISHNKVKSPFEYIVSTARATNAEVHQPYQLFNWCNKMGQKIYYYQAPTGFPDQSVSWTNAGALVNRMNFGLAFATQKIPGIKVNWAELNHYHEPESAEAALYVYSDILLPARDLQKNINRLLPLIKDIQIEQKITLAAKNHEMAIELDTTELNAEWMNNNHSHSIMQHRSNNQLNAIKSSATMHFSNSVNNTIAQVAGIIIGSPEFQRK